MPTNPLNDSALVTRYTPWVTMAFLEGANVAQLWRMWTDRTAAGQELTGWLMVTAALLLWLNYYRVIGQRPAILATLVGIGFNLAVAASVLYFR